MTRLVLASFLLLLHLYPATSLAQTKVHVTPTGGGNFSGSSWSNAISGLALQNCLKTSPAGTTILVSSGTYKPTSETGINARFQSFSIASGIEVYGGYVAGTDRRNLFPYSTTVFSGNINRQDDIYDNSFHVVTMTNVLNSTIFDGITVTGGAANLIDVSRGIIEQYGGGLICKASDVNNVCSPTISNCYFSYNISYSGGAFYGYTSGGSCSPKFINSSFVRNDATFDGGAFQFEPGCKNIIIDRCKIHSNSASSGAGISIKHIGASSDTITIINSTFDYNGAGYGASLSIWSPYSNTNLSMFVDNCTFTRNMSSYGPILDYASYSTNNKFTLICNNSIFFDNSNKNIFVVQYDSKGPCNFVVNNSLLTNGTTGFLGTNNIFTLKSPFKSVSSSGYTHELAEDSEAIDTGDLSFYKNIPAYDLNNLPRVLGKSIDIGALELCVSDTIRSVRNGDWSDSNIWSKQRIPSKCDLIILSHKITVPYSLYDNIKGKSITIKDEGALFFNDSPRLLLGK